MISQSLKAALNSEKSEKREETSVEMGIISVLVQNDVGGASSNQFFVTPKLENRGTFGAFMHGLLNLQDGTLI